MLIDIVQDAERLLAIVENLLLLTRSGPGVSDDDREPTQLAHLLRRICRSFSVRHCRQVTLRASARGDVVDADRGQLELLMENLLGNADKFSLPDRPIEVILDVSGNEALVRVLDRGIGIGEARPEELFAPFRRGAVARRVTGGMGLGLAAARQIVDGHGGRMWAERRDGGGTEVGFTLPLLAVPES
jgi:signal transduction histidine kinase